MRYLQNFNQSFQYTPSNLPDFIEPSLHVPLQSIYILQFLQLNVEK